MSPEISAPKAVRRAAGSQRAINRAEKEKRQALIDACRRMNAPGINRGTSGNISVPHGEGMPIAPAGVPDDAMTADQIVYYMIAAAGGDSICCEPYAIFGTPKLWERASKVLEGRFACLLDRHGMIAIGPSLEKALWLAVEIETLARQNHGCLQIRMPPLLPSDEIERVGQKMAGYGHANGDSDGQD
jgi:ribulose-5-phosphate 4-epimerase/fuculose-1-phosphate aldolase